MTAWRGLAAFGVGLAVGVAGVYALTAGTDTGSAVVSSQKGDAEVNDHGAMAHGAGPAGLSLAQDGYVLTPVSAPAGVGERGQLSFQILDPAGRPFDEYVTAHQKKLHLIVVRTDGRQFRHVHPVFDESSRTWTIPWAWTQTGTYRVFADFEVKGEGSQTKKMTLARTVEVGGDFAPAPATAVRTADEIDGYTVSVEGHLVAGVTRPLTFTVTRDGQPVTSLQPYLGAFGHLVALRDGDLAYLHAHPEGAEPAEGQTGGPTVAFGVQAPTAGRYLLYLDFQISQAVRTATFVVDAARGDDPQPAPGPQQEHAGH
ncbi:heavy-metal-associated domain-containing protein [Mycobacteroides franklinii]|uniref:heavy-metal-associated domain-containing protein n=1 Tax=Mycobacteroides franklinii TaxID=948102 RepID=UPI0013E8E4EB|nr:heavy metal-binding domain-containing protein [Mycobacteroides franklinii]